MKQINYILTILVAVFATLYFSERSQNKVLIAQVAQAAGVEYVIEDTASSQNVLGGQLAKAKVMRDSLIAWADRKINGPEMNLEFEQMMLARQEVISNIEITTEHENAQYVIESSEGSYFHEEDGTLTLIVPRYNQWGFISKGNGISAGLFPDDMINSGFYGPAETVVELPEVTEVAEVEELEGEISAEKQDTIGEYAEKVKKVWTSSIAWVKTKFERDPKIDFNFEIEMVMMRSELDINPTSFAGISTELPAIPDGNRIVVNEDMALSVIESENYYPEILFVRDSSDERVRDSHRISVDDFRKKVQHPDFLNPGSVLGSSARVKAVKRKMAELFENGTYRWVFQPSDAVKFISIGMQETGSRNVPMSKQYVDVNKLGDKYFKDKNEWAHGVLQISKRMYSDVRYKDESGKWVYFDVTATDFLSDPALSVYFMNAWANRYVCGQEPCFEDEFQTLCRFFNGGPTGARGKYFTKAKNYWRSVDSFTEELAQHFESTAVVAKN